MTYYMMEVENIGAVCKADKINAKNFTSAKRTASKKPMLSENNFIQE